MFTVFISSPFWFKYNLVFHPVHDKIDNLVSLADIVMIYWFLHSFGDEVVNAKNLTVFNINHLISYTCLFYCIPPKTLNIADRKSVV